MPQMRVVVVSRFRLYRDALAGLFRDLEVFELVDAIAGVSDQGPSGNCAGLDAVLTDARLIRNRAIVTELRSRYPGAWVVAVSVSGSDREAVRCTRSGVDGIISHEASAVEIVNVMNQIRTGEFSGSGRIAAALFSYVANGRGSSLEARARLTPREREVALLAARGLSNKRIALDLNLEIATVKNNMHNILRKCGLSRRSELAARLMNSKS